MSFKVCTYNMGSNEGDYLFFRRWEIGDAAFAAEKKETDYDQAYTEAQNQIIEKLTNEPVDVYLLQEVMDKERPLIKRLTEIGYTIFHNGENDTAVALDPKRFDIINEEYLAEDGIDIATVVTATDKITGKVMRFVSTHIAGFDLTDAYMRAEGAEAGDKDFQTVMTKLNESQSAMTIVGGDFNTSPEIWNKRFNPAIESGFQMHRINQPTAVNPRDKVYREREIDFVFSKQSWFDKVTSFFLSIFSTTTVITSIETSSEDITKLKGQPSDHIPVFLTFKSEEQQSLISRVWVAIFG